MLVCLLMHDQQRCPLTSKHFWHKRKQTDKRTTTSLSAHHVQSYFNLFKHSKKNIPVQHTKGTLWVRNSQLAFHYSTLHPLGILALTSCLCSQTFFFRTRDPFQHLKSPTESIIYIRHIAIMFIYLKLFISHLLTHRSQTRDTVTLLKYSFVIFSIILTALFQFY